MSPNAAIFDLIIKHVEAAGLKRPPDEVVAEITQGVRAHYKTERGSRWRLSNLVVTALRKRAADMSDPIVKAAVDNGIIDPWNFNNEKIPSDVTSPPISKSEG